MYRGLDVGRWVKVFGWALLSYGFIVFADEAVSELIDQGRLLRGNSLVQSPWILGSYWGWPGSGIAATYGVMIALTGVFILNLRSNDCGMDLFSDVVRPAAYALANTVTVFLGWCLVWTSLLAFLQPGAMNEHVTQYLAGSFVSNTFVLVFSASALGFISLVRFRGTLLKWLPHGAGARRFTAAAGPILLSTGVFVLLFTLTKYNPHLSVTQTGYLLCEAACSSGLIWAFFGFASGAILLLVGAIFLIEKLVPREAPLW